MSAATCPNCGHREHRRACRGLSECGGLCQIHRCVCRWPGEDANRTRPVGRLRRWRWAMGQR